jgi:16S rRNA (cytidine1402-2'-O)-methyltransferase
LVALARSAGHRVLPLPGASAVVTALSAAGDTQGGTPGRAFVFAGFLPAKGADRQAALDAALDAGCAAVLFEAPHRIDTLFERLAAQCPARTVTVCRELTKQFEQIETHPAAALPAWLAADAQRRKGEFVLVVHAPAPVEVAPADALPAAALRSLKILLRELPLKQATALTAEMHALPRKALYQQALAWKADAVEPDASD